MKQLIWILGGFLFFAACQSDEKEVVNVYSHRHYDVDRELMEAFTESTGIEVQLVSASADELIQKLSMEGENSPADILITVDAGRLERAKAKGLFQPVSTPTLQRQVPRHLRDDDNHWYGLTSRARILAYHPNRVERDELSTYEALADDKWEGRILARSSSNVYNQSLLASIIEANGIDSAKTWARKVKENLARSPQGGDRDQIKAVAAGEGDVALVNTYYIGLMLNDKDERVREAAESVELFFPNSEGRGTHVNVSGAGVTRHAPNKENAIALLEYLTGEQAQSRWASANYEYPVNPEVTPSAVLQQWETLNPDTVSLSVLGEKNEAAVRIFNEVGWN